MSSFAVDQAPQPTTTQQPVAAVPQTEMYVLGIGVAIILAIAIVGTVLFRAIKKRQ